MHFYDHKSNDEHRSTEYQWVGSTTPGTVANITRRKRKTLADCSYRPLKRRSFTSPSIEYPRALADPSLSILAATESTFAGDLCSGDEAKTPDPTFSLDISARIGGETALDVGDHSELIWITGGKLGKADSTDGLPDSPTAQNEDHEKFLISTELGSQHEERSQGHDILDDHEEAVMLKATFKPVILETAVSAGHCEPSVVEEAHGNAFSMLNPSKLPPPDPPLAHLPSDTQLFVKSSLLHSRMA